MYYIYIDYILLRYLLADTSANHMARPRGTPVPHRVQFSCSVTLLAIVHMHQEHYMYTLGSQRTKKAFCNWSTYFVFVYQRPRSYKEHKHVPLGF